MSLCPEAAMRAAMSDGEFWEHALHPYGRDTWDTEPDPDHEAIPVGVDTPCPECGAAGACAWDIEGRPLIHATTTEET